MTTTVLDVQEAIVLDVQEAIVIRPGDTLLLRVARDASPQSCADFRAQVVARLGDRVADVVIVAADGMAVIREVTP